MLDDYFYIGDALRDKEFHNDACRELSKRLDKVKVLGIGVETNLDPYDDNADPRTIMVQLSNDTYIKLADNKSYTKGENKSGIILALFDELDKFKDNLIANTDNIYYCNGATYEVVDERTQDDMTYFRVRESGVEIIPRLLETYTPKRVKDCSTMSETIIPLLANHSYDKLIITDKYAIVDILKDAPMTIKSLITQFFKIDNFKTTRDLSIDYKDLIAKFKFSFYGGSLVEYYAYLFGGVVPTQLLDKKDIEFELEFPQHLTDSLITKMRVKSLVFKTLVSSVNDFLCDLTPIETFTAKRKDK